GTWVRLEVEAKKVGLKPGRVINGWAFTQHGGTVYWDKAGNENRAPQAGQRVTNQTALGRGPKSKKGEGFPEKQPGIKKGRSRRPQRSAEKGAARLLHRNRICASAPCGRGALRPTHGRGQGARGL